MEYGDQAVDFAEVDYRAFSQAELSEIGNVYFLQFFCKDCKKQHTVGDPSNPRGWMRIYVGFALDVSKRVQAHNQGRGAKCTRSILLEQRCEHCGSALRALAVHVIHGAPRAVERAIKRTGHADRFVPGEAAYRPYAIDRLLTKLGII